MYWIFWLIAGATISIVAAAQRDAWHDRLIDLAIGMAGALIGGLLFVALQPPRDAFLVHIPSLMASVAGTILLLAAAHLVRRAA